VCLIVGGQDATSPIGRAGNFSACSQPVRLLEFEAFDWLAGQENRTERALRNPVDGGQAAPQFGPYAGDVVKWVV
jgi:hypothetical protein